MASIHELGNRLRSPFAYGQIRFFTLDQVHEIGNRLFRVPSQRLKRPHRTDASQSFRGTEALQKQRNGISASGKTTRSLSLRRKKSSSCLGEPATRKSPCLLKWVTMKPPGPAWCLFLNNGQGTRTPTSQAQGSTMSLKQGAVQPAADTGFGQNPLASGLATENCTRSFP